MSKTPKNGHFLLFRALLLAHFWPKPEKNLQGTCVYALTTPPPSFIPIVPYLTTLKRQKPLKTAKTAIL